MFGYFFGRLLFEAFVGAIKLTYFVIYAAIVIFCYICVGIAGGVVLLYGFLIKQSQKRRERLYGYDS